MNVATSRIDMKQALGKLAGGVNLSRDEARSVMEVIMSGEASPSQIAGVATALRMKGETKDEITGFAEAMRSFSSQLTTNREGLLDTCGTGGSGIHKFNISTSSAIIAAAAGIRVAKHGNRAMSGKAGSADVLEALNVQISLTPDQAADCLEKCGICFMFAQLYHPSLKHAAVPRKELGIRTIFNILGPLANPAGADRQLMGLYDRTQTELIAGVLGELGLDRAIVVGSHDGLDEISISEPTRISELKYGVVTTYDLVPEDIGLTRYPLSEVIGGDPATNASIIRAIFEGEERGAYRDIVLANAAACIYIGGKADSMQEGVAVAAEMIDSGAAKRKLDELIQTTGELANVSR